MTTRRPTRNAASKVRDGSRPPWASWRGSNAGRRIRFIETYLVVPRGTNAGKLVKLRPFQTEYIEEVYAEGILSGGLSIPRGNSKTATLGMLSLAELHLNAWSPDIGVAAITMQQSARPSGVYGLAVRMSKLAPELDGRSIYYSGVGDPRIRVDYNDGLLAPIASRDADSLLGLSSSLLIADEFGADHWDATRWGALVQSAGKRGGDSRVLGISTPNSKRSAMYSMRERVLAGNAAASTIFVEYAADADADITDRSQWFKANPALGHFLDISALESDVLDQPAWLFKMMRLGLWQDATEDGWLGIDGPTHWDATTASVQLSETEPTFIGVDKSMRDDCSAVAMLQRVGDRWQCTVRIFHPAPVIDHAAVRGYIRECAAQYNVVAVGFDPRFAVESMQELEVEGLPVVEVPQSVARMVPAYSALHRDIIGRQIDHDDDPTLRSHVLSAVPQVSNTGGFMLAKNRSRQKIDGVVALAIARSLTLHDDPIEEPLDLTEAQVW